MIRVDLENKQIILTEQQVSEIIGTEMSHVQSPAVLPFGDLYRMYFCSRKLTDSSDGNFVSRLYSVDFEKDSFELVKDSRKEISSTGDCGTFDEFGMTPVSAISLNNQTHLYYAGWSRAISVPYTAAIGVLIEDLQDPPMFQRLFKGPVISFDENDSFLMGSPRVKEHKGKLFMFYVGGTSWDVSSGSPEPTYKIRMAISDDGYNWRKIGKDLISDSINAFECQAAPEVIAYGDGYIMLYSFRSNLRHDPRREYQIGIAYSTDLINWITLPAKLQQEVISRNLSGTSYYNMIEEAGQIRVFYQLPGMGKEGIGTGILKIEGEF
jgi:predicted GH43/DUF377 family glycosyl hydrolase